MSISDDESHSDVNNVSVNSSESESQEYAAGTSDDDDNGDSAGSEYEPPRQRKKQKNKKSKNKKLKKKKLKKNKKQRKTKKKYDLWSDEEMYDLLVFGSEYQLFSSGLKNIANLRAVKEAMGNTRSTSRIKEKVQQMNKRGAAVQAAMNADNYKKKDGTGYLRTFKLTSYWRDSQKKWYKYWEKEIGSILGTHTLAIEDNEQALDILDMVTGDDPDTNRRIKTGKIAEHKKNEAQKDRELLRERTMSAMQRDKDFSVFLKLCGSAGLLEAKANVQRALLKATEYLKLAEQSGDIVHHGYWTEKEKHKQSIRECLKKVKSDTDMDNKEVMVLSKELQDTKEVDIGQKLLDTLLSNTDVESMLNF